MESSTDYYDSKTGQGRRRCHIIPTPSKLFEVLLLAKLTPVIAERQFIPSHQFGFRSKHAAVDQIYRVTKKISIAIETKNIVRQKDISQAFLDISQAFDKVWHDGLIYKIQTTLPFHFLSILKSYLQDRHFLVMRNEARTGLYKIHYRVPQGSVLGPVLYSLFTANLPTTNGVMIATYADDTAILATHSDSTTASKQLQNGLDAIQKWLKKWQIKANETKSVHITFTTRREVCPPVYLNSLTPNEGSQIPRHVSR